MNFIGSGNLFSGSVNAATTRKPSAAEVKPREKQRQNPFNYLDMWILQRIEFFVKSHFRR
jgi:hypothetical protein